MMRAFSVGASPSSADAPNSGRRRRKEAILKSYKCETSKATSTSQRVKATSQKSSLYGGLPVTPVPNLVLEQ
jgi:hypothetical protein